PGKAEAELANMSHVGLIDAVVSDNSNILVFGAITTFADKVVKYYFKHSLAGMQPVGLSCASFVLVAVLCRGNYNTIRLSSCGTTATYGQAGYHLGEDLCYVVAHLQGEDLAAFLVTWKKKLPQCLSEDPNGYIGCQHLALVKAIPALFPDMAVVCLYINPVVS
ncbi:hypothetical protein BC835DRAFT_1252907, partial [Cytidiella melzeri]